MVNLRSRELQAGSSSKKADGNSSKATPRKAAANAIGQKDAVKGAGKDSELSRSVSRGLEKAKFLKSPHVHTRASGRAPEISLSTELPELAALVGDEGLDMSQPEDDHNPQDQQLDTAQAAEQSSDIDTQEGDSEESDDEAGVGVLRRSDSDAELANAAPDSTVDQPVGTAAQSAGGGDEALSSDIESGSEEDSNGESGGNELTGLARAMWEALEKQRGGKPGLGEESRKAESALTKPLSFSADKDLSKSGRKEVVWTPQHNLPAPAQSGDYVRTVTAAEPDLSKKFMVPPRDKKTEAAQQAAAKERPWHDLPEQVLTDELKRDLRLLRLRGAMDTKRFYKKAEKGKFPTKFALGTVIEGPTEFFSGRLTNRERKQTITDELLADEDLQDSRKRRFGKMQAENSRWSHKKHKGAGERLKKRPKRPKH